MKFYVYAGGICISGRMDEIMLHLRQYPPGITLAEIIRLGLH